MNASIVSGAATVLNAIGLPDALAGADWVVTGEGCLDRQSLRGKVVSGVVEAAREQGIRVAVVAGRVALSDAELDAAGIEVALATAPDGMPLEEAMHRAEELTRDAGRRLAREIVAPG